MRKQSYATTGFYIKNKEDWNDDLKAVMGGVNRKVKNEAIQKRLDEADARLLSAIAKGDGPSIKAFKGKTLDDFEAYCKKVQKDRNINGTLFRIKELSGGFPHINEITETWLLDLEESMKVEYKPNTIRATMVNLGKVCTRAVKDGFIDRSPFGGGLYELPKKGKSIPRYLIEDQRNTLYRALLEDEEKLDEQTYKVLAYFNLGIYTGLRFCDWEPFDPIKHWRDNMLNLQVIKNKATIHQEVHPDTPLPQVLSIIKRIGKLNLTYSQVAGALEKIKKIYKIGINLTTHLARHSFGYLCASIGVSKSATAYFMGVTDEVVDVYYHLTGKHIQEQSKALANIQSAASPVSD